MEKIAERIKELIDNLELTNTEFAKQADLNPATVSHILGGRNKASLQVIDNIKRAFTNVNTDYLISGSGSLFKDVTNVNNSDSVPPPSSGFPIEGVRVASIGSTPLQDKTEEDAASEASKPEITETAPSSTENNTSNKSENGKRVERIVFFYADGTFKSYRP